MHKGFSLIEILIALSLMALLGSFVIPNMQKVRYKSYRLSSEINLKTFQSAIENYFLEHDTYPVGQLSSAELFKELSEKEVLRVSPMNPYYKKPYSDSDSKGKITYASTQGDSYELILYGRDGKAIALTLVNY